MARDEQLIRLFEELDRQSVRVTFRHGGIYNLRIVSTMHAAEGGDVVADVIGTIQNGRGPTIDWSAGAMNFFLKDVTRVEKAGECLFPKDEGGGSAKSGC